MVEREGVPGAQQRQQNSYCVLGAESEHAERRGQHPESTAKTRLGKSDKQHRHRRKDDGTGVEHALPLRGRVAIVEGKLPQTGLTGPRARLNFLPCRKRRLCSKTARSAISKSGRIF